MMTQLLKKNDHLLLTLEYPPFLGGVAIYLFNLFAGGDYQILCHGKGAGQYPFFYKYFWPRWLKIFFYLLRKARTFKVLHISHILPLGYVAYLLKILLKKKYIIYLHGLDFNLMKKKKRKAFWGRRILLSASLIVCNSQFLKNQVIDFLEEQRPEIQVIYPAPRSELVNLSKMPINQAELDYLRQKYYIADNDKILLSVGRLVKRKGVALVLEALGNTWPKNLKYFIIGIGPEEKILRRLIRQYHLEQQVYILNDMLKPEDLVSFWHLADLFILPTLELDADVEGFGIVFIEAGLFTKAVIAGQGAGVNEAVLHEKTGIILKNPQDLANLKENLLNLLNNDEKRQEFAQANQDWAKQFIYSDNYLWKILSNKIR